MDRVSDAPTYNCVDVDRIVPVVVAGVSPTVLGLLMWMDLPGPQDLRVKRVVIPRGFYAPDTPSARHCLIVLCGGKQVRVEFANVGSQDVIVEAAISTKTRGGGWADVATVMEEASRRDYSVAYVRSVLNG